MRNIVLVGFMGAGKTTVGKILASKISYKLYSTDKLIAGKENASIASIFEQRGERYFRHIEHQVVKELASKNGGCIIDCGGGIVENKDNMRILKEYGAIVWLKCSLQDINRRIDGEGRPLFQQGGNAVKELYKRRTHLYQKWADYTVDAEEGPLEVAEQILSQVNKG
ncbi:shikimate kinase [Proteinivorax hydrogeniformans]|uniref:Shikimate kinase n=2 Tax=Proteinivorax hydrogeniformans TaxID=1826727 RepID=A0AAU8HXE8_9FIRM